MSCATLQEAQTITLGILFSLYGECIPLGSDAAQLLGAIIDVAEAPFRKGAKRSPALIVDCLPWFHLGTSTLLPAISPIPSFEPDHLLPRTEPSPLLKALCAWIQPSFWEEYSLEIRMQLTAILGIGLRACNTILRGGRSLLDGHRLTSTLVEARKDVLGTSGLVMQVCGRLLVYFRIFNGDCSPGLITVPITEEMTRVELSTKCFFQCLRFEHTPIHLMFADTYFLADSRSETAAELPTKLSTSKPEKDRSQTLQWRKCCSVSKVDTSYRRDTLSNPIAAAGSPSSPQTFN